MPRAALGGDTSEVKAIRVEISREIAIFDGQWWLIFTQPLAAFFLLLAVIGMLWPVIGGRLAARRSRIDPVGLNE